MSASGSLQDQAVALLQQLIRLDTTNPPGRETTAQEPLAALLRAAGFEVELAGADPARLNLVARLRGRADGPVLGLLSHVDTVPADPRDWRHGPWSGDLADGMVWGRGALDMKSQTAAETIAACSLAHEGWRPAAGDLLVISVADEEVAGSGAEWLCRERPELVRCDHLLNEGDGAQTIVDNQRVHGVCVGEKGVFRFRLTTRGAAGHASMPEIADNALLRLAPLLVRFGAAGALQDGLPPERQVTFAPTMVSASDTLNTIPAAAHAWVDCRVPPGEGRETVRALLRELLGDGGYELEFTEQITGNASPADSPLMEALRRFMRTVDPGAVCRPTVSPGYSDSRTFRDAFPDCVAYGFFPQRAMTAEQAAPLFHAADERIPVADLGLAVDCYRAVARDILG